MAIDKKILAEKYPKFIGFDEVKESLIDYIANYYNVDECKKIELVRYDQTHLAEVKATFLNGCISRHRLRAFQRWYYNDSGTL